MICKVDPPFWTPRQEAIHCIYVKVTTKKWQKQSTTHLKWLERNIHRHDLGECLSYIIQQPPTFAEIMFDLGGFWIRIFAPTTSWTQLKAVKDFRQHSEVAGIRFSTTCQGPQKIIWTPGNWKLHLLQLNCEFNISCIKVDVDLVFWFISSIIASPPVRKPATERPTQNDPNMIKCAIYRKHSLIFWEFLHVPALFHTNASKAILQQIPRHAAIFISASFWELYHQGVLVKREAPEISDHRTISHLISIHWMETSTVWRCGELVP